MPYSPLPHQTIKEPKLAAAFRRADWYMRDVYGMFRGLPPADGDGGKGDLGTALILLCVIDGLSEIVWPNEKQEKRFKELIRSRLHWGPAGGKWFDRAKAAKQMYVEFRNPLVHELATDKPNPSRPSGYAEPIIARWGEIPHGARDIAAIDGMASWNDAWPILYHGSDDEAGSPRLKLVTAALYWAVKRLAGDIITDNLSKP